MDTYTILDWEDDGTPRLRYVMTPTRMSAARAARNQMTGIAECQILDAKIYSGRLDSVEGRFPIGEIRVVEGGASTVTWNRCFPPKTEEIEL